MDEVAPQVRSSIVGVPFTGTLGRGEGIAYLLPIMGLFTFMLDGSDDFAYYVM
nr:hypothetical protein [Ktedonobacteraceae bacterium]